MAAGCGSSKGEDLTTAGEMVIETERETQKESEKAAEAAPQAADGTEAEKKEETMAETAAESGSMAAEEIVPETSADREQDDNFSVDGEETEAFACLIKEAAVRKDLEALAELTRFPVYIGFPDGGMFAASKEDFLTLDPEKIFTEEWIDSVTQADEKNLPPSMAGFVLSNGKGGPNVVFGLRDGQLGITGMNY